MIASKIVGRRVASVSQARLRAADSPVDRPEWQVFSINFEGGGCLVLDAVATFDDPIVTARYHPGRRP